MNSQQLLFINFIIFLALVLYFIFGRSKPRQSIKLDLRAGSDDAAGLSSEKNETVRVVEAKDVTQPPSPQNKQVQGKALGFIYNGHEWEAYEVLGLPRGCSLQTATSHYQNLIKTSDPSTFEFYEAAFTAILKANQN